MIRLLFLTENFKVCGRAVVQYKNLIWDRQWYESGKFSVLLHKKYFSPLAKYVYTPERKEVGVIGRVQVVSDGKNENIMLSGFFAEQLANDKIIWPTFLASGTMKSTVVNCFEAYKEDLPIEVANFTLAANPTMTWQSTGKQMGEKFNDLLKPEHKTYRVTYDEDINSLAFYIAEGVDRSDTVIFSKKRKNVTSLKADIDETNHKNYFVIGGKGEGNDREVVVLDLSAGGYKKKQFINASSAVRYDEDEMTQAEYQQLLLQYGTEKAEKYALVKDIEVSPTSFTYQYLKDYDLGDLVTVDVDETGLTAEMRIIAVKEVVKNGTHTISITFGEKKITTIQKARLED